MDRSKRRDEFRESGFSIMFRRLSSIFIGSKPLSKSRNRTTEHEQAGLTDARRYSNLNVWGRLAQVRQAHLARQITDPSFPTLLGIPGELRNKIYRFALVEDNEIEISSTKYLQPGLLRTCQQLRNEASSIFSGENEFTVFIDDCKLEPRLQHWVWSQDPDYHHYGEANWTNLKAWLKLYFYDDSVPSLGEAKDDADDAPRVYQQAFEIVYDMREAGCDWDVTEKVLESFKSALDVKNGGWRWQ